MYRLRHSDWTNRFRTPVSPGWPLAKTVRQCSKRISDKRCPWPKWAILKALKGPTNSAKWAFFFKGMWNNCTKYTKNLFHYVIVWPAAGISKFVCLKRIATIYSILQKTRPVLVWAFDLDGCSHFDPYKHGRIRMCILLFCGETDDQMTSNDIKWHQMTSNDIKWHQMTSNDIKWQDVSLAWARIDWNHSWHCVDLIRCMRRTI